MRPYLIWPKNAIHSSFELIVKSSLLKVYGTLPKVKKKISYFVYEEYQTDMALQTKQVNN